jgi:hypothetical protein
MYQMIDIKFKIDRVTKPKEKTLSAQLPWG